MTPPVGASRASMIARQADEISTNTIPQYPYEDTLVNSWATREPHPSASNPVLTTSDVTDTTANTVADPFLFDDSDGTLHMFFEVANGGSNGNNIISHATSTDDGVTWTYDQIVLDDGTEKAFPQVWKYGGEYYMSTSNGAGTQDIELWQASTFPTDWTQINTPVSQGTTGVTYADPIIFYWNDTWWVFAQDLNNTGDLYAYYSSTLESDGWSAHSSNPLVSRPSAGRPGGRPIVRDNNFYIPYMDNSSGTYGEKVHLYEVTDLTTSSYSDSETVNTLIGPSGSGWNSNRMHHWDPWWFSSEGRWVTSVDGHNGSEWSIGMYHQPTVTDYTVSEV